MDQVTQRVSIFLEGTPANVIRDEINLLYEFGYTMTVLNGHDVFPKYRQDIEMTFYKPFPPYVVRNGNGIINIEKSREKLEKYRPMPMDKKTWDDYVQEVMQDAASD